MAEQSLGSISEHFSQVEDPRIDRNKLHPLLNIIVIAICAVICGAENWVDVELYGELKKEWLAKYLDLSHGIPSHDTFGRVFRRLKAESFQGCFLAWVKAVNELTQGQVIAIDGKELRHSLDSTLGKRAIHMISAWATENELVLAQQKVDEKSNEITAIPELLEMLEIAGCIITIDAMGCQKEIAKQITDQKGDYVLAVKENQGHLYEEIDYFCQLYLRHEQPMEYFASYEKTVDKDHGRIEIRECWTLPASLYLSRISNLGDWSKVTTLIMVRRERRMKEKTEINTGYYISSLQGDAKKFYKSFVVIGALKTRCIGFWICVLTKTNLVCTKIMGLKTWLLFIISLSICCVMRKQPKVVSKPDVYRQVGIMTTCSKSSIFSAIALDIGVKATDFYTKRKTYQNQVGKIKRGIGMAVVMHGSSVAGLDMAAATLKMNDDGSFNLLIGATDLGTGSDTILAQIAAEVLCIPLEDIIVYSSDTDFTPFDKGAYASSTTYLSGEAVRKSAEEIAEQIKQHAAVMLNVEDYQSLKIENRQVVAPDGREVTFEQVGLNSLHQQNQHQIMATASHVSPVSPPPTAAQFVEIMVDTETGEIEVERMLMVVDCGRVINPVTAAGQVEGGMAQALGFALKEEMLFTSDGQPTNPNLAKYKIPRAQEMPIMDVIFVQTDEPTGPYGAKSVAEISIDGVAPAMASAIHNATGVWMREVPYTKERVQEALSR